jgi:hypothetical protein
VLFCMMSVICVLCRIVVPLPPGKNPFAVKINYEYSSSAKCHYKWVHKNKIAFYSKTATTKLIKCQLFVDIITLNKTT